MLGGERVAEPLESCVKRSVPSAKVSACRPGYSQETDEIGQTTLRTIGETDHDAHAGESVVRPESIWNQGDLAVLLAIVRPQCEGGDESEADCQHCDGRWFVNVGRVAGKDTSSSQFASTCHDEGQGSTYARM